MRANCSWINPAFDCDGIGKAQAGTVGNADVRADSIEVKALINLARRKGDGIEQGSMVCAHRIGTASLCTPPAYKAGGRGIALC
jgi:hypothetical protein